MKLLVRFLSAGLRAPASSKRRNRCDWFGYYRSRRAGGRASGIEHEARRATGGVAGRQHPCATDRGGVEAGESRTAQARAALLPDFSAAFSDQNKTSNLASMGIKLSVPIPGFQFPSFVGPFTT